MKTISGRAFVFGDDINTDVMTPAWVCFDYDPKETKSRSERMAIMTLTLLAAAGDKAGAGVELREAEALPMPSPETLLKAVYAERDAGHLVIQRNLIENPRGASFAHPARTGAFGMR